MNKKFWILVLAVVGMAFQSCSFDDQPLWDAVEDLNSRVEKLEEAVKDMNGDLAELQKLVAALQNNVTVTEVNTRGDGYEIRFSDGSMIVIKNGKDGQDGQNGQNGQDGKDAPVISIKQDVDGVYYWTIDGKWLLDGEGKKMAVEGQPGQDGENAPVPQIRINKETSEWEISVDGGETWEKTGVFVNDSTGTPGVFSGVDNSNPDFVIVTLFDGTEIKLDRYTEGALTFEIEGAEGVQVFLFGETLNYKVKAEGVADYSISKPDGWRVSYDGFAIDITALAKDNSYGESEGVVAFNLVSENGRSMIVKIHVQAVEFRTRVLTFEDADWKGTSYTLDYCGATINTWSDLVPESQAFGDILLYGQDYMASEAMYMWQDENNTMLSHIFPDAFEEMFSYMYGGHALSNFVMENIEESSFNEQLAVSAIDPVTGKGGHNGSETFCVHFGTSTNHMSMNKPALMFMDGVARVIDHMYVVNTTFGLNVIKNGGYPASPLGQDGWMKIVAIGYDENFEESGRSEFFLAQNGTMVTDWTKWDLSSLGAVTMVDFDVEGSDSGDFGLNSPAYFAYDDVAVRF